ATRRPPLRRMCAINAVTVLLPLVPVTQIVRACGFSANHNAVPDVKRTPARVASGAGDLYGLMPGDLITISNCASAAASGAAVTTSTAGAVASDSAMVDASAGLQNNVRGFAGKRRRNAASAARPSRP